MSLDGARPPLYPALLALVLDASSSQRENFTRAKVFTRTCTLTLWVAFLFFLRRFLKPYTALTAWLALGFTLWMFYAPYVKADALFYFFATGSFVGMVRLLWRPDWRFALLTGFVTAIGFLLKASLSPAVIWFSAVQLFAALVALVRSEPNTRRRQTAIRRALTVPLVAGSFLAPTSPYLVANEAKFGHYFYNVNSDFYLWYDSWGESGRGTRGHGDRDGWPDVPPNEIPSARRYFQRHGLRHALRRVGRGTAGLLEGATKSYGFLPVLLAASVGASVALVTRRSLLRGLHLRWPLSLFCGGYFGGYFLGCTWFYAIHPGMRFVAALVPPALIACGWLADRGKALGRLPAAAVFPLLVGGCLLVEAPEIVRWVHTLGVAGW